MGLDANDVLLHIKSALRSSARLAFQSASEYPVALGVGMLLLFLHRLCPALLAFFLSSSPVFLLTALLLGALLSYGEPGGAPVTGDGECRENPSPPAVSTASIAERCPVAEEVQSVSVAHMPRSSSESPVARVEETKTTSGSIFHETRHDEGRIVAPVSADALRFAEAPELAKKEVVIVEREEQPATKEICEKVQLQQFRSSAGEGVPIEVDSKASEAVLLDAHCAQGNATSVSTDAAPRSEPSGFHRDNGVIAEGEEDEEHVKEICEQAESAAVTERCGHGVSSQYQFGELMSSCWQPVITRQDPCSESESDLTESSSDASITDIIPMLDELNPPVDLGTGHPSSAFREDLSAGSSDENEDGSDEEEDNNLSSDEDGEEEDKKKKGDGNNWKGFVDPNSLEAEEENGNLDSLMARRRAKNALMFELDRRLMDMEAADANGMVIEPEKPGSGDKDAGDDHSESESDSEEDPLGSNGRLFGSLEPRIGDEIRILGAAVSDVCVLEANLGSNGGSSTGCINATDSFHVQKPMLSSASDDVDDSTSAGNERPALRPLPEEDDGAEEHVVEEEEEEEGGGGASMSEANSLFKCRMEQVLVQSVSESGIGQPLTVRPGRELSDALLRAERPATPSTEARSAEELLSSQLAQVVNGEALALAHVPSWVDDANPTHVPSSIGGDIAGDGEV